MFSNFSLQLVSVSLTFVIICVSCDITSNLLGQWSFTNGNLNDNTGNGNDATSFGASPTSDRFGDSSSAYYFDGNDYITMNNANLNIGSAPLTIHNCKSRMSEARQLSEIYVTQLSQMAVKLIILMI